MDQRADRPAIRILNLAADIDPLEARAVGISFVYFFFLMASYFILRPLRDTMGRSMASPIFKNSSPVPS